MLLCTHDLSGQLTSVNAAAIRLSGYSRDQLLAMNLADLLVPEERPGFARYLERIRSTGAVSGRMRIATATGDIRVWEFDNTLRTEGVAQPLVRGLAHDVTEREATLDALRESERGLREAQHVGRVGSYAYDIPRNRWSSSAVMDSIFGIDDTWPRDVDGWERLIHPADREAMHAYLLHVLGSRDRFEREYRIVRPADGSERWVLGLGELERDAAGAPVRLIGTIQDITDRRQTEAALRLQSAALNAAANAIVITDRAGTIEWVNAAFCTLSGYDAAEAVGRNPRDLVRSGAQDAAVYAGLWQTILAGKVWHGEMVNRRKDGSEYLEDLTITPVPDDSGAVTHFIALKRDLTEERRLQQQLLQTQKIDSVGQLAGGVAHDFNNLLTVINAATALASEQLPEDHPARADLDLVAQTGERAAALTQQLLAFSRRQMMQPEVLSLGRLVRGLEPMLRRLIGEDIELVTTALRDEGSVQADVAQLEQVVMNLVVNARDAMPMGGTLSIETRDVDFDVEAAAAHPSVAPGRYVQLAISDTGSGMDEATRSRIFEPFFTTKEFGKGTGLGLATVYGVVKQSGGSIWVYSEPGAGSTFKVYLPLIAPPEDAGAPAAAAVGARGTETILLVEDETTVRRVATRILRAAGYTVLSAGRGVEAKRLLAGHEGPVHLLLSDVVLPGMSGPALAEQVTAIRPDMRVLYTSGYTDDAILRHGVLHGHAHFIGKPYTIEELTRKVREVLDGPPPDPE